MIPGLRAGSIPGTSPQAEAIPAAGAVAGPRRPWGGGIAACACLPRWPAAPRIRYRGRLPSPRSCWLPSFVRALRYTFRIPFLLWHVLVHLPLTLLLMTPPLGQLRVAGGDRLDHRVVRWWSG